MTTLNDFSVADGNQYVLASYYNLLLGSILRKEFSNAVVMTTDLTLTDGDTAIQRLDCNGANRIVKVPPGANGNHPFFLINISAGNFTLTVKSNDGATTHQVLGQGEAAFMVPDGNGGYKDLTSSAMTSTVKTLLKTYFDTLYGGISERIISGPQGFGDNYVIVPSISANNLIVALKGVDGNDPSASNPLRFRVGDSKFTITAAVSYQKDAATNWCKAGSAELAGNAIDFFLYAIAETGASAGLKFGHSRIPYATTMSDFVNTVDNEKYIAGNWTNFNATDRVENIGRFRAQLSATAAFNWSIASQLVKNKPTFATEVLTWTPVITYSAESTNPTSNTPTTKNYQINYRTMVAHLESTLVRGSGNKVHTFFTLPFGTFAAGTSPANGLDSITAAGLSQGTTYISGNQITFFNRTMTNNGSYYATVTHTLS